MIYLTRPADKEANARKEMELQASLNGPRILKELLSELRLLRVAVEKLSVPVQ
jgi:hypothetical protein